MLVVGIFISKTEDAPTQALLLIAKAKVQLFIGVILLLLPEFGDIPAMKKEQDDSDANDGNASWELADFFVRTESLGRYLHNTKDNGQSKRLGANRLLAHIGIFRGTGRFRSSHYSRRNIHSPGGGRRPDRLERLRIHGNPGPQGMGPSIRRERLHHNALAKVVIR